MIMNDFYLFWKMKHQQWLEDNDAKNQSQFSHNGTGDAYKMDIFHTNNHNKF